MKKETKCRNCGEEISTKAAVCPKCGVKNKKPIYKRGWFIAIAAIVVIGVISSSQGGDESATQTTPTSSEVAQQEIVYTEYTVSQLVNDLEDNALNAKNKYDNQYVKITGDLSVIDSSGKYISLDPSGDSFNLTSVQCYLQNDEQKARVASMKKGDSVTLKGKVTDVGEVFGYSIDIDSIE